MITQNRLKELFYLDDDENFRWKTKATPRMSGYLIGKIAGRPQRKGYMTIRINGVDYEANVLRWIWECGLSPPDDKEIYHIDHNPLDIHISNLKLVDPPKFQYLETGEIIQEDLKELFDLDKDENFIWKNTPPGNNEILGAKAGTLNPDGYLRIHLGGKTYLAHRLRWLYEYGNFPKKELDHINRNKLDNRITNLTEASRSKNLHNRAPFRNNTSGTKGVRQVQSGNWTSTINYNGKHYHLGTFKTKTEAIKARKEAEKRILSEPDLDIKIEKLKILPTQFEIKELFYLGNDENFIHKSSKRKDKIAGTIRIYRYIKIRDHLYQAHILRWLWEYGEWPNEIIDHIDGDPLNNKINNLRLATKSQNNINKPLQNNNTIGAKGISHRNNKWHAKIGVDGKNIPLGSFETKQEAIEARNQAEIKYHGEFRRQISKEVAAR